jgi:hypothetical protein
MFDNIGGKIKAVAKGICWAGIISSCIAGIVLILMDEATIPAGLLVLIIGPLASWVGSFMTYGLGQLIENSDILVENSTILIEKIDGLGENSDILVENTDKLVENDFVTIRKGQFKEN